MKKVYSTDQDENLRAAIIERDRLRENIKNALNILDFHKDFLGEPFVRTKLINTLKRK